MALKCSEDVELDGLRQLKVGLVLVEKEGAMHRLTNTMHLDSQSGFSFEEFDAPDLYLYGMKSLQRENVYSGIIETFCLESVHTKSANFGNLHAYSPRKNL